MKLFSVLSRWIVTKMPFSDIIFSNTIKKKEWFENYRIRTFIRESKTEVLASVQEKQIFIDSVQIFGVYIPFTQQKTRQLFDKKTVTICGLILRVWKYMRDGSDERELKKTWKNVCVRACVRTRERAREQKKPITNCDTLW